MRAHQQQYKVLRKGFLATRGCGHTKDQYTHYTAVREGFSSLSGMQSTKGQKLNVSGLSR
jgi:hypothetical protein